MTSCRVWVIGSHRRASSSGEATKQHDEEDAGRIIQNGMNALRLREADLLDHAKGDLRKCALEWLAHTNSTASHEWIASRLHMGSPSNMSTYIDRIRKPTAASALSMRNRLERGMRK